MIILEKYDRNEIVYYDNGHMKGVGMVVGVATVELPAIGITYILKDMSKNIPNSKYNFEYFVCSATHLSKKG